MAKINLESLMDQLEDEFRKALQLTVKEHFPDQDFNARAIYKTFRKEVYKKCDDWEDIPNKYIRS